jgi:hypothetical protein
LARFNALTSWRIQFGSIELLVSMQTIVKRINPYLLLALLIIGYYALAFFPYELATRSLVENQAQFLSDGSLSFERGGIALSLPPA